MPINEYTVQNIAISEIKFDPTNPNTLTQKQKEAVRQVMKKYGFLVPVILNKNMVVIDGQHRVEIYDEEGKTEIPAIVLNVKEVDAKILRQIMNKLHGQHDRSKDALEFKSIYESGKLQEFSNLLAQRKEELQVILEKKFDINFGPTESDLPLGLTENPTSKLGDIYELGPHRLMCGDATKDTKQLLSDSIPRLVFTDPPYEFENVDYLDPFLEHPNIEILVMNGDMGTKRMLLEYHDYFIGFYPIVRNKAGVRAYGNQPNMEHSLITHYRQGRSNFQNLRDAFGTVHEFILRTGEHRYEKPIELPKSFIIHYTKPGEVVVDLFGGTGSTLIASEQTERICYTMELDPRYVDYIINRWEKLTNKKAKKIGSLVIT